MDATIEPQRRRFTIEEYHRLAEAGVFRENERLELIEGEIVEMSPIGRVHAATVDRIAGAFFRRLGDRAGVRVQGPVLFADLVSEVQPDVTLLVPRPDFYAGGHPDAASILLVVEVMDGTAAYDRDVKLRLYARAGVREVWLVHADRGRLEALRRPGPDGYGESRTLGRAESIAVQALADVTFTVRELLG